MTSHDMTRRDMLYDYVSSLCNNANVLAEEPSPYFREKKGKYNQPSCTTQQQNPYETPLRDLKKIIPRPKKIFEPRPINYNNPYPLHRKIEIQNILPRIKALLNFSNTIKN